MEVAKEQILFTEPLKQNDLPRPHGHRITSKMLALHLTFQRNNEEYKWGKRNM